MPWWLRTTIGVVAVVALLVGLIWFFQRRLIYLPDTAQVPPAAQVLTGGQDVTLHTADGLALSAWYVPAPGSGSATDSICRPTVIVANGNAGNRLSRVPLGESLVDAGFGVLLVDYRGYADNPGSPDEQGLAADLRAARHYLTDEQSVRPGELIYYGESLGAAVMTSLAAEQPPAGLVLRSPFSALAAVAQQHYPFLPTGLLLRDTFPVLDTIGDVRVPTTVIYGTADSVVDPEQSRAVAAAAGGPVDVVQLPGADHNDPVLVGGPQVIDAVVRLADRAGCSPRP